LNEISGLEAKLHCCMESGLTCQDSAPDCDPKTRAFYPSSQDGLALFISLMVLGLMTLIGLFLSLNATTEIRISHNHESDCRARYAAMAGLEHARALLKGADYDSQLKGPDGISSSDPSYIQLARLADFRNPISWTAARTADVSGVSGLGAATTDDGILNMPAASGYPAFPLIPQTGIGLPGAGTGAASRYFVKAADNNGESSETAEDFTDDPFADGDGIIILRSFGLAPVIRDLVGSSPLNNSVAAYEARVTRGRTFRRINSPLLVIGNEISVSADADSWTVSSGPAGPGIAAIDIAPSDAAYPEQILRSGLAHSGPVTGNCTLAGGGPDPDCIRDITAAAASDPDLLRWTDPAWVADLIYNKFPGLADAVWGDPGGGSPMGNSSPRIVYSGSAISLSSPLKGEGILVVTGKLSLTGGFAWDGIVLVAGSGSLEMEGSGNLIRGMVILTGIQSSGGSPAFKPPSLSIRGSNHRLTFDPVSTRKAIRLLPSVQIGFREITTLTDP
jgi:hypothetical protein